MFHKNFGIATTGTVCGTMVTYRVDLGLPILPDCAGEMNTAHVQDAEWQAWVLSVRRGYGDVRPSRVSVLAEQLGLENSWGRDPIWFN